MCALRKTNKNDFVDAEAIAEAVQRPTMRFVQVKTDAQLDLQALHRAPDVADQPNPRLSLGAWCNCANRSQLHAGKDAATSG